VRNAASFWDLPFVGKVNSKIIEQKLVHRAYLGDIRSCGRNVTFRTCEPRDALRSSFYIYEWATVIGDALVGVNILAQSSNAKELIFVEELIYARLL
jgi:hypothetical protein